MITVHLPELGIKIRDVVLHEYTEYRNKKDSGKPFLSRLCALSRLFLDRIWRFVGDRFLKKCGIAIRPFLVASYARLNSVCPVGAGQPF